MIGTALILADGRSPYDTFVQLGELTAIRTEGDDLRTLLHASEAFRSILLRAVHLEMVQIAEGLVSAAGQQIAARLARWLLMYPDRLGTTRIEVTHEVMALMIGAQRPRITAALHELESDGAIRAGRGHVVIRDAERLEVFADGGDGTPEREEQRLVARRPDA